MASNQVSVRDNTMSIFKTRLHELMEQKGWDRTEVVRQAILKGHHMSYQTVRNWDDKPLSSVSANALLAFMDVFDCALEELIYLDDDEDQDD